MITPIDVLCLAISAGGIALEGQRGIIASGVDLLLVIGIAVVARYGYGPLSPYIGAPSWTYALLVAVLLGSAALISIVISRRVKVLMTPLEATVAAFMGLLSGAVLTFILFEWLAIRYGPQAPILQDSIIAWLLYDFAGFHALVDLYGKFQGPQ
jgi:hypothetical protein